MSLLNLNFPVLDTYTVPTIRILSEPSQPTSGLICLKDFIQKNRVWYCMFTTQTSFEHFKIKELMGNLYYTMIKNKRIYLILDMSFEPFLLAIDSIYQEIVVRGEIPPSQIIFLNNMYDSFEYNKEVAARYNCEPIKIFYFSALEFMIQGYLSSTSVDTLEVKNYDKKYLNLNRRWRSHRPLLTVLLYNKKLLEKGFVSFGPCENNRSWNDTWDLLKCISYSNEEMFKAITDSEDIKNIEWLYLDTDELDTNRAEPSESLINYYQNSYFSVISETTFFYNISNQNSRFITEKTFKSIMMKHPFVLVSIPKSLEVLKSLGYRTFSPWIDESYDNEIDDAKRMMMIVKEVERLCNLSDLELTEFLIETKKICEYNYNILRDKKNFIFEKRDDGQIYNI